MKPDKLSSDKAQLRNAMSGAHSDTCHRQVGSTRLKKTNRKWVESKTRPHLLCLSVHSSHLSLWRPNRRAPNYPVPRKHPPKGTPPRLPFTHGTPPSIHYSVPQMDNKLVKRPWEQETAWTILNGDSTSSPIGYTTISSNSYTMKQKF